MATVTELREHIPVRTPLGDGYAILVETGGHDQYWTVVLASGALVTFRQDQIRLAESYTQGRGMSHARMRNVVNKPLPK